jgi:hypothetical protein
MSEYGVLRITFETNLEGVLKLHNVVLFIKYDSDHKIEEDEIRWRSSTSRRKINSPTSLGKGTGPAKT